MALISIRVWRTRGVYVSFPAFVRELRKGLQQFTSKKAMPAARARVANWKIGPEFKAEYRITPKTIKGNLSAGGVGGKYWRLVSGGVQGHWIVPRRRYSWRGKGNYKPTLRLQRYRPKTLPSGSYGGAGVRYGPTAFRRAVWWTGIVPRNFEGFLKKELAPEFSRIMENASRRGVRAAQREGR